METHPLPEFEEEPFLAARQCYYTCLADTFLEYDLICIADESPWGRLMIDEIALRNFALVEECTISTPGKNRAYLHPESPCLPAL